MSCFAFSKRKSIRRSQSKDFDSTILVDHLWALRRDELTAERQKRLASLIGTDAFSVKGSSHCDAYFLALRWQSDKLSERWKSGFGSKQSWDGLSVLIECLRYIQTRDLNAIQDIISIIDQPAWMFHPRYQAMIAVAGMDAARETNAADVISRTVHDSTPEIIATRNRALEPPVTLCRALFAWGLEQYVSSLIRFRAGKENEILIRV